MGLRGTIPPAGVDLLGAGPYHLPLPEGEDVARGSGNSPLTEVCIRAGLLPWPLNAQETSRLIRTTE